MSVKIKVSYENEQELQDVITRLGPDIKKVKPSKNQDGKYKKAYILLKLSVKFL